MNIIQPLSKTLIEQISAGEVIESPVGVVKELVENSIDALSTKIEVFINGNGFEKIIIRDNGFGIGKEDLPLALESYATSKLHSLPELFDIRTMGFRGEALGSIRSVSKITIESKLENSTSTAYKISAKEDTVNAVEPSAIPKGTQIVIEDLFFNVPVRKKILFQKNTIRKENYRLNLRFCTCTS